MKDTQSTIKEHLKAVAQVLAIIGAIVLILIASGAKF
jgi:hypothetical protein